MESIRLRPRPAYSGTVDTRLPIDPPIHLIFVAGQRMPRRPPGDSAAGEILQQREVILKVLLIGIRLRYGHHVRWVIRKDGTGTIGLDRGGGFTGVWGNQLLASSPVHIQAFWVHL